jgi:hypothetical protein
MARAQSETSTAQREVGTVAGAAIIFMVAEAHKTKRSAIGPAWIALKGHDFGRAALAGPQKSKK